MIFMPAINPYHQPAPYKNGIDNTPFIGRAYLILFMVLIAWFIVPGVLHAAEVNAYVDRIKISSNDSVNLTVAVKDGEGDVDVSPINDFKVLSRGTSSNISIVNGKMTKETRSNFALIPLKKGTLVIPALNVAVGGKTYQTKAIEIHVSDAGRPAEEGSADLFMKASVAGTSPFVGEQFTYTIKIYHAARITNARFQQPEFKGFEAKKIENDRSYSTVVSSRQYNVIELNYVLIPVSDGPHSIEPAVLSCSIGQRDSRGRSRMDPFFDDSFFSGTRFVPKTVSSDALDINVKPLPSYKGNAPFSGLVGDFNLSTAIDKAEAAVGDSLTLSITLSGSGNIIDATEPEVEMGDSFKVYKDAPEEKIDFDETGYSGKKTFRLALVPIKEGTFLLPPVTYIYFDVLQERYQELKSSPISLTISPSKENPSIQTEAGQAKKTLPRFDKKQVEFVGHDILPLKEALDAVESRSAITVIWFLAFLMIPAGGYAMIRLWYVFSEKSLDDKTLMTQRAMQALKKASKAKPSEEAFLSALYTALVSSVFSVSGSRGESLTYAEVRWILTENGFDSDMSDRAAGLLEQIESARYSGKQLSSSDRDGLLSEVKHMIRRML